jgi:hypothetical protein
MKLCDILKEGFVDLPDGMHQQITSAVTKWRDSLASEYYGSLTDLRDSLLQFEISEKVSTKLERMLDKLFTNIHNTEQSGSDTQFIIKTQLTVAVPEKDRSGKETRPPAGSFPSEWGIPRNNKRNAILRLFLTPEDVVDIVRRNPTALDTFVATIEHELTHSIQLIRTKWKRQHTKPFVAYDKTNEKELDDNGNETGRISLGDGYWMAKLELGAYATGTISKVRSNAERTKNPLAYISQVLDQLRTGELPNETQSIDDLIKVFNKSGDIHKSVAQARIKAKRLFIKTLYQGLVKLQGTMRGGV